MKTQLRNELVPDADTRQTLSLLTEMLNNADLTQFMTRLQQFIEQATTDK